jgi:hypothetical protein
MTGLIKIKIIFQLSGIIFSVILQLFSCFPKIVGHYQNWSKMAILKRGVDGFSYFSLISVILLSNQDHPCTMHWLFKRIEMLRH